MLSRVFILICLSFSVYGCHFLKVRSCESDFQKKEEIFLKNPDFKNVLDRIRISNFCEENDREIIWNDIKSKTKDLSTEEKEIYYTYLIYVVFYNNNADLSLLTDYIFENSINIDYQFNKIYRNNQLLNELNYSKADKERIEIIKKSISNMRFPKSRFIENDNIK